MGSMMSAAIESAFSLCFLRYFQDGVGSFPVVIMQKPVSNIDDPLERSAHESGKNYGTSCCDHVEPEHYLATVRLSIPRSKLTPPNESMMKFATCHVSLTTQHQQTTSFGTPPSAAITRRTFHPTVTTRATHLRHTCLKERHQDA